MARKDTVKPNKKPQNCLFPH